MKKILASLMAIVFLLALAACAAPAPAAPAAAPADPAAANPGTVQKIGNDGDVYYMVTFLATIEFWDECYVGFQDAAKVFGATTEYTGAQELDINEQITILDQVIATNPTGITVTCTDAEALRDPINRALAQGIEVVCFDADSINSGRYSILATGNVNAGDQIASAVCEKLNGSGQIGLIFGAGLPTYEARAAGIRQGVAKYPGVQIVAEGNFNGEQDDGARAAAAMIQANPDLSALLIVNASGALGCATAVREAGKQGEILVAGFDHDAGIYEAINSGEVFGTAKQGAYNMGFWSMMFLFTVANDLVNPVEGWRANGLSPLPASVDTGVNIVTQENLSAFWQP